MGLDLYRGKRDFTKTPEPRGGERSVRPHGFVVQKHAARRLHYDFRLELDGALKSWAVPKGPSLVAGEKRLAVQTEDHPLEYADFEGVIPAGQYGGGTVLVWDRGRWEPVGDPRAGYAKGHLEFRLEGTKLHGAWMLVRLRANEGERPNWLLIKKHDEAADGTDPTAARPESVLTGRRIEGVAASADRVWNSDEAKAAAPERGGGRGPPRTRGPSSREIARLAGARRARLPDFVEPQLATLVETIPSDKEMLYELKLDGYRLLARIEAGQVRLLTRQGHDWTARFPTIASMLRHLSGPTILDGEVVALDERGISRFQLLQDALADGREGDLVYYAFDLIFCLGFDLRAVPLRERKRLLARALEPLPAEPTAVRLSEHLRGDADEILREACRLGLEGLIAKPERGRYRPGHRADWLKIKCQTRQELVIVGFTDPKESRRGLGALLLGLRDERGELRYAGKVGTGFSAASLAALHERLRPLEVKAPAAHGAPRIRGAHWVRPELVAEIAFANWTKDGLVRHASFQGLREDKPSARVRRERPASVVAPPSGLTHGERVLFAGTNVTKADLAAYYEAVGPWALPHATGRPLMLLRCPQGAAAPCFHQKHATRGLPAAIRRVRITESTGTHDSLWIDSDAGLLALVQMNVLEIHTWGARVDDVERPDMLVFDLDPDPRLAWREVVTAAQAVRALLQRFGLGAFVKTTGGKGLHVVTPLVPDVDWDSARSFARAITDVLVGESDGRYINTAAKIQRRGKVFVDYLRNGRGATAVAPYSPRARGTALVATPVSWEELEDGVRPSAFGIRSVPARLAGLSRDPWADFARAARSLRGTGPSG